MIQEDNPLSLSLPDLFLIAGTRKWGRPWTLLSAKSARTEVAPFKRLVTVFGGSYAPQEHDYTEIFKGSLPKSRLPEESDLLLTDYEEDTYAYYMTKLWGLKPLTQDELEAASKEAHYDEVEE